MDDSNDNSSNQQDGKFKRTKRNEQSEEFQTTNLLLDAQLLLDVIKI